MASTEGINTHLHNFFETPWKNEHTLFYTLKLFLIVPSQVAYYILVLGHNQILTLKTLSYTNQRDMLPKIFILVRKTSIECA